MFIDTICLKLIAGKGGDGIIAWRREKYVPKGGPCGGNAGKGGAIYIESDSNVLSLEAFANRRIIKADNGKQGGPNRRQGGSGKDLIIKVPCGTLVKDVNSSEILYDLTENKQKILLCKGGKGGKGNDFFKTATNQAPNRCTPGLEGEEKDVELELKLIADIGFIGMPNAGKSTLLSKITKGPAKVGAYPFTTLKPNLSYIEFDDYSRIFIADIPGIINKAHENKGLGLSFLRHIERCSVLVYLIDLSAVERENPIEDFHLLRNELRLYSEELANKPFLVALNKMDHPDSKGNIDPFYKELSPDELFCISALKEEGLDPLIEAMRKVNFSSKHDKKCSESLLP